MLAKYEQGSTVQDQPQTIAGMLAKATPPGLYVAADKLMGIPLERWVTILTIVYLVLQIVWLIYSNVIRPWRRKRSMKRGCTAYDRFGPQVCHDCQLDCSRV